MKRQLIASALLLGAPLITIGQESQYPLVRVTQTTQGCNNWKEYDDWIPCLEKGIELRKGETLLLIRDGEFLEGAIVQRHTKGKGYGPRYWTQPQFLQRIGRVSKAERTVPNGAIGMGFTILDVKQQFEQNFPDLSIEKLSDVDGQDRWMGHEGVLLVEAVGLSSDIGTLTVMHGLPNDAVADSVIGLMQAFSTAIVLSLPFEERSPVATWAFSHFERTAADVQSSFKETYLTDNRKFTFTWLGPLASASLTVEGHE